MGERLQILQRQLAISAMTALLVAMRADCRDDILHTCEFLHDGSGLSAELCDWDVLLEIPVVCLQKL